MSISLNGLKPKDTYQALIKVGNNTNLDGTNKVLSDGLGNDLPIQVSTTEVNFTGAVKQSGITLATTTQLNLKQDTLVSGTNIKTVNSTTLLGSGDLAVQPTLVSGTNIKTINSTSLLGSGDIVINTPPSGVSGAIQFSNGSAFSSDASNFFWDDTNKRLGIGTNIPTARLHIEGVNSLNSIFTKNHSGFQTFVVNNQGNTSIGVNASTSSMLTVKGSGTTSATTSLLVQNSSGAEAFKITDNAKTTINSLIVSSGSTLSGTTFIYAPIVDDSNLQRIYWNANELDFFTNGSSSMRITKATKNVLIGTTTDITSSKLTVESTTQGALLPRMTTTQRNAIATPATGLIVYDTTLLSLYQYNGTAWTVVGGGTVSGVAGAIQFSDGSAFSSDVSNLFWDDTNNRLGVGINTPTARLHTKGTGTTSATNSFKLENSNNSKSLEYNDAGELKINYGGATTTLNGFNIYTYNIYAPNGASRVQLDGGAMTLIDSAGQQNIVCQNNQTYIAKPLKLMSGTLTVPNASAQLDIESTTKGFLPPRMTTTQVNAIVTPANGLMVYNTTIDHMCVYQAGAWVRINHSPM
jgi:hypothetical protein